MTRTGISSRGFIAVTCLAVCLVGCGVSPERLLASDISLATASLRAEIQTLDEPISGALDVHEAVARAIKFNAALRTQEFAVAFAEAKARAQDVSMLPSLIAESRFYGRNNASLSRSSHAASYSTSSDRQSVANELTLSWNILDFGLSYVRQRQTADKIEREREEVRRVATRVMEETRVAYWRAVALAGLVARLEGVRPEVEQMLATSKRASRDVRIDPLVSLNYERDVLNLQRDLNQMRTSLAGALEQLKHLIGVPQGVAIRLQSRPVLVILPQDAVESDITRALSSRAEIRQIMLDLKIADHEVHATLLQLLPGISLSRGLSSDSNSFLLNGSWMTWGAKLAWDLINLAHLPRDIDAIEAQQQLHRQQALAMAATISMQVYLSRARVEAARQAAADATSLAETQVKLLKQVRAAAQVGTVARQALTKERLATLLADVRADLARSDLEAAAAAHATSMGQDPALELDVHSSSVAAIADALRRGHALRRSTGRMLDWTPTIEALSRERI